MLTLGVLSARKPDTPLTSKELGSYVRRCRERRELTQLQVAELADMRGPQVSLLETGANVEVQFYERVARALNFRNALEMFMSGGDEKTRKLLRLWRALPDDEARNDALRLMQNAIVSDEEPSATASAKSSIVKRPARAR